jgi:hypothetical protein
VTDQFNPDLRSQDARIECIHQCPHTFLSRHAVGCWYFLRPGFPRHLHVLFIVRMSFWYLAYNVWTSTHIILDCDLSRLSCLSAFSPNASTRPSTWDRVSTFPSCGLACATCGTNAIVHTLDFRPATASASNRGSHSWRLAQLARASLGS